MKTKILLSVLLSFYFYLLSSQVPQGFNYQAIARDSKGNPITNSTIKIKLSILTDTSGFYATGGGTYVWEEEQTNVKTNAFGLITVVFGDPSATKVQGSASSFSALDWAKSPLFIGTKIASPTEYKNMGSAKLWSVPYSMVADSSKALLKGSRLSVVSSNDVSTDALFEVKRKDGQTVFAVYPNAVNVYVPRTTPKGVKGGFAIGGFDGNKITPQDYLRVTPDSVRIYIDKTPNLLKGATKGGFAIGGFDQTKNTNPQDLLTVSNDSIRMYINDASGKGTTKGGFAIGGFDQAKGGTASFLDVATNSAGIINPSQNRILWYPIKNAFLAGRVLIEKPDSVGENSFATGYESKAKGQYSQALGYQAIAMGQYSTSIGYQSVANQDNSFAFGQWAQAKNQESYAFGRGAIAEGFRSFAFGSAGVDSLGKKTGVAYAKGDYSFALGQGSQALGFSSFALGIADTASGWGATAMGYETTAKGGSSTSIGAYSVASGNQAFAGGKNSKASSYTSLAFGSNALASGFASVSMGSATKASGDFSVALGIGTIASGHSSVAFGYSTEASGGGSTAMGSYAKAIGVWSFAAGDSSIAGMNWAVALGYHTLANGYASLVGGDQSRATGNHAFAFGSKTLASGWGSFALGDETKATGAEALTIGYQTQANGWGSSAFGNGTVANSYATIVFGRFNDTTGMINKNWYSPTDPAFEIGNGTSNADRKNAFTVLQNGYTAIGHTSPTEMLDVNGNARFRAVGSGTYSAPLDIASDGTLTTSTSDITMKKDIVPISQALQKVLEMNGVFFSWKNDDLNNRRVGFIAQDMEKVLPEVVFTNPIDGLKGINYPEITAVLAQAVKEQQQIIEKQQSEIDHLKSLENEVSELKALVNTIVANQAGLGNK